MFWRYASNYFGISWHFIATDIKFWSEVINKPGTISHPHLIILGFCQQPLWYMCSNCDVMVRIIVSFFPMASSPETITLELYS